MHSGVQLAPRSLVVSLDIGTHGSGFAFATRTTAGGHTPIKLHEAWPAQPAPYPKTRSAILYDGRWAVAGKSLLHKGSPAVTSPWCCAGRWPRHQQVPPGQGLQAGPARRWPGSRPAARPEARDGEGRAVVTSRCWLGPCLLWVMQAVSPRYNGHHPPAQVMADFLTFLRKYTLEQLSGEVGAAAARLENIQW
ncbi:heat shock protein 12B [Haematococcus lacustris]|uniref:Heat shock protein 12B n=1 Tax=Haematococcus lacustris TaxID=44745 RepID=A0A699ZE36_HAELA|nr:heat shock protein 12B [Haematococcus lacustris]